MNVFLLVPILGFVPKVVLSEMSEAVRAHESENYQVIWNELLLAGRAKNEKGRTVEGVEYIYIYIYNSRDQL